MGKIYLGVNMEFIRSHDKPFAWGVEKAAEIGYQYIEPMVHWGRELLSEAGYFHSVSMYDDPLWVRELCDKHHIKLSGLSAHTPLCKPEISVEYLKQAIRWAADAGAGVVNTDEGPKPEWTTKEMDYTLNDLHLDGSRTRGRATWDKNRSRTTPAIFKIHGRAG